MVSKQEFLNNIEAEKQRVYYKQLYKINDIQKKIALLEDGAEKTRLEKHLRINIAKKEKAIEDIKTKKTNLRGENPFIID